MISFHKLAYAVLTPLAVTISLSTTHAGAHPRGHEHADQTEGSARSSSNSHDDQLDAFQQLLDASPTDEKTAVAYARYAVSKARRLGDTDLLRQAEHALSPWDDNANVANEVLIVRANIKQIDHRFDDALSDLEIVLRRQPSNPQALLSRAFILATTGDAKSGIKDCAALKPNVSLVIRETCAARLSSLTGALDASQRRMKAVLQIARTADSEERNFALAVAAEIAQRNGAADLAEQYYSALLATDPESVFARAAYADFLLNENNRAAALEVIGDAPHTEALLLLSALGGNNTNDALSIKSADELSARMASDRISGDFSHAREYARFAFDYLNDPELALVFAQENWRVQKEPIDARILARAAIANGAQEILINLKQWLAHSGFEDPKLERILMQPLTTHGFGREASISPLSNP
ncbi:MAG: hypothetical protein AAFW68_04380 [Pseudomonadota bacterium]